MSRLLGSKRLLLLVCFAVVLLSVVFPVSVAVAASPPLTSVPGSPFTFASGVNSNVVTLSPNQQFLFVSNQQSSSITVLRVGLGGRLSLIGTYPTSGATRATGMVTDPCGRFLYVTTRASTTGTVNVHQISRSGALTQIQAAPLGTPSAALNGIVYVMRWPRAYLYVNNDVTPNTITGFKVLPDGTLSLLPGSPFPTGGSGIGGYFGAPKLGLHCWGDYIFAVNGVSNNISVFKVSFDGSIVPVPGSPFSLPPGYYSSGAIAISGFGSLLFAGTDSGDIVAYKVGSGSSLSLIGVFPSGLSLIDGLKVHPSGRFLVATSDGVGDQISVLKIARDGSLSPLPGSPVLADYPGPAGVDFNFWGTLLFVGNGNLACTSVSVYYFPWLKYL
jgi:6-phosphogluconolactonase (cycloisomerase 2 family)